MEAYPVQCVNKSITMSKLRTGRRDGDTLLYVALQLLVQAPLPCHFTLRKRFLGRGETATDWQIRSHRTILSWKHAHAEHWCLLKHLMLAMYNFFWPLIFLITFVRTPRIIWKNGGYTEKFGNLTENSSNLLHES